MRPQSRTGAYGHRPPNDNINWGLENGAKKRAQKKEVFYFTSLKIIITEYQRIILV